ncbi:MAG: DUF4258 domain-containing protein [Saprospiraceae bacterium]
MNHAFSNHAKEEMRNRQIPLEIAEDVLNYPDQSFLQDEGKMVFQGVRRFPEGRDYLVRIFVNIDKDPSLVITLYRTSKIEKYLP